MTEFLTHGVQQSSNTHLQLVAMSLLGRLV
jgi:hypothetical protein